MYKLPKSKSKNLNRKLTKKELNHIGKQIKQEIKQTSIAQIEKEAFVKMLAIPAMVINDHYNLLTKVKDEKGLSRAERMVDMCIFQYECLLSDNVKIEELIEYLKTLGIDLEVKANE